MSKEKISKHDEYVELATPIVAYINLKELIIGVYCTDEDMLKANNNLAIKRLKIFTIIKFKW